VLEEVDLVEMGITNAAHRLAILQAASKCPPVSQTGFTLQNCIIYVIVFTKLTPVYTMMHVIPLGTDAAAKFDVIVKFVCLMFWR